MIYTISSTKTLNSQKVLPNKWRKIITVVAVSLTVLAHLAFISFYIVTDFPVVLPESFSIPREAYLDLVESYGAGSEGVELLQ